MAEIHETVEVGNTNSSVRSASSSSSSVYHSARIEGLLRSRSKYRTAVDFEIAASEDHWSELQQPSSVVQSSSGGENENAALSNREIMESLQRQYPQKARFFADLGDDLQLGEKIAEGGQAEIFEATVKGFPHKLVLKVFKGGSSLLELQRQWPLGMFTGATTVYAPSVNCSPVICGTVVMNGRFAFQMFKCSGDLRKFIDKRMLEKQNGIPLSEVELESSMYEIAVGMKALHKDNIVHRDLKAANVLINDGTERMPFFVRFLESRPPGHMPLDCLVADFECSVGVIGTGFWRAPEILQGLKDRNITPDLFTKKADVYSYAMTCYEMITGQLPFEGVRLNDYDVVLLGERPLLPDETSPWIKALLSRCWHANPNERPEFKEIVKYIKRHSPLLNSGSYCWFKV